MRVLCRRDDGDAITGALAAEYGYAIVPSADDKAVIASAGTATLELLRQAPGLSVILVPVGGVAWRPAPQ